MNAPATLDAAEGRAFARRLALIFVVALILRLGIRLVTGVEGYWIDGYTQYAALAHNLVTGDGYAFPGEDSTAFRVPLYPLFIAAVTWGSANPWVLIVAQALVASGLAAVTGLIARRLHGPQAGLVAAAWCAAYPYYAWHHVALVESGLFAFLTAVATLLLLNLRERPDPRLAVAAGVVLGAALLTRAMLLPFVLLAVAWLALPGPRMPSLARRLMSAALVAAATVVVLSPWLIRSHALTGSYSLGTEGGQSLYAGASPLLFSRFPGEKVDESLAAVFAAIPPRAAAERDRYSQGNPARESDWYTRRALEQATADPGGYAMRAGRKLAIAFGPLPAPRHGLIGNAGYAAWWVPLLLLGLAGAWRDRREWCRNLLIAAHFAAFCAVTALIWAQTSHRSYLDLYLMVLAAPVLVALLPGRLRDWLAR